LSARAIPNGTLWSYQYQSFGLFKGKTHGAMR
jgi:hypothetical protein